MDRATKRDKANRRVYRDLLVLKKDEFLGELAEGIKNNDTDSVMLQLSVIKEQSKGKYLQGFVDEETEDTILHLAVKYAMDKVVFEVIDLCPELLFSSHDHSTEYKGQSPLHIAITKGNFSMVQHMTSNDHVSYLPRMLEIRATGENFINTIMMGELPLSVAALGFYVEIFELLVERGAKIATTNSQGDTVIHSLIKYVAIYPENIADAIEMMNIIHEFIQTNSRFSSDREVGCLYYDYDLSGIWLMKNNENLTPLLLAAKHGLLELFQFMINIKNVYCFMNTHDGLFDIKMYDITDLDSVASLRLFPEAKTRETRKITPRNTDGISRRKSFIPKVPQTISCLNVNRNGTESVLEMFFGFFFHRKDAFSMLETSPIKHIVKEKWKNIRGIFYLWFFIHCVFVISLTAYTILKPDLYYKSNSTCSALSQNQSCYKFLKVFQWIVLCVGILYCFPVVIVMYAKVNKPNALHYILHNSEYALLLGIISVCLISEFFYIQVDAKNNDNVFLIISLISSWWFILFFLRGINYFSFFTTLLKKVILGDLVRFFVVILFNLVAFGAAMHVMFSVEAHQQDENFDTYWATLLTMFKLMIGIGEIDTLYDTRVPWLSVLLFIVFVILTYVLLFNALIAMMSQTCSIVIEDRYPQWRYQQLSIILFLEELLLWKCTRSFFSLGRIYNVVGINVDTKQTCKERRCFFQIHSLQQEYASAEEKEQVVRTIKKFSPPKVNFLIDENFPYNSYMRSSDNPNHCTSRMYLSGLQTSRVSPYRQTPYENCQDKSGKVSEPFERHNLLSPQPLMKKMPVDHSFMNQDNSYEKSNQKNELPTTQDIQHYAKLNGIDTKLSKKESKQNKNKKISKNRETEDIPPLETSATSLPSKSTSNHNQLSRKRYYSDNSHDKKTLSYGQKRKGVSESDPLPLVGENLSVDIDERSN